MIPKKIHYCWFGGGEKPKLAKKCISSWETYCPDFEIIEWNENNFDVNMNGYTKMCYETKKWAFLSDYVRLWVVNQYGGVYFDTDVEVVRKIDFLLDNKSYFGYETIENEIEKSFFINTGLGFGAEANSLATEKMIEEYNDLLDGTNGVLFCPELNTKALKNIGCSLDGNLEKYDWGTVYPIEYFNPYESTTGVLKKTKNTVSIHWYMGSCVSRMERLRTKITKPFHRLFGNDCFDFLKK